MPFRLEFEVCQKLAEIDRYIDANRSERFFRNAISLVTSVGDWVAFVMDDVAFGLDAGGFDDYVHFAHWRGEIESVLIALPEPHKSNLEKILQPFDAKFFECTESVGGTLSKAPESAWWLSRIPKDLSVPVKRSFLEHVEPFRTFGSHLTLARGFFDPEFLRSIEGYAEGHPEVTALLKGKSVEHYLASWREFGHLHSYNDDLGGVSKYIERVSDRDVLEALLDKLPNALKGGLLEFIAAADSTVMQSTRPVPGSLIEGNHHWWWRRIPKGFDRYTETEFLKALKPSLKARVSYYLERLRASGLWKRIAGR